MTDATDLGEIVVVGKRRKFQDYNGYDQQDEVPENPGDTGSGGSGGWTIDEILAENQRQKDCAAEMAGGALKGSPDSNKNEWFSHIFKDGADNTVYHAPRGGTGPGIASSTFTAARNEFGISSWNVLAIVHNHPAEEYCNGDPGDGSYDAAWQTRQTGFNQFPSENDWAYADTLGNPDLTLYVVGCDGVTRGFRYSDQWLLRPLVQPAHMQSAPVPPLAPPPPSPCAA